MIKRVRSTYGQVGEYDVAWQDDEIHPYFILDGVIYRDTGRTVFTQYISATSGRPISGTQAHPNLLAALADLGWEPV